MYVNTYLPITHLTLHTVKVSRILIEFQDLVVNLDSSLIPRPIYTENLFRISSMIKYYVCRILETNFNIQPCAYNPLHLWRTDLITLAKTKKPLLTLYFRERLQYFFEDIEKLEMGVWLGYLAWVSCILSQMHIIICIHTGD